MRLLDDDEWSNVGSAPASSECEDGWLCLPVEVLLDLSPAALRLLADEPCLLVKVFDLIPEALRLLADELCLLVEVLLELLLEAVRRLDDEGVAHFSSNPKLSLLDGFGLEAPELALADKLC